MTGGHRPIAVLLTLAFLVLLALGLVMGTAWALGLLGRLDTCLAAILLTALAVAAVISLGLRAVSADGERQTRWERRLHCYRELLEGLQGVGEAPASIPVDVALLAGPGVVKTLNRLVPLTPANPSRSAALAALLRELRRDLGQSSSVLSEVELLALLPPIPCNDGGNPSCTL